MENSVLSAHIAVPYESWLRRLRIGMQEPKQQSYPNAVRDHSCHRKLAPPKTMNYLLFTLVLRKQFIQLLLIRVVIEILVQVGARLHQRNHRVLRAFFANGFVDF